jgi:hypothetical protein
MRRRRCDRERESEVTSHALGVLQWCITLCLVFFFLISLGLYHPQSYVTGATKRIPSAYKRASVQRSLDGRKDCRAANERCWSNVHVVCVFSIKEGRVRRFLFGCNVLHLGIEPMTLWVESAGSNHSTEHPRPQWWEDISGQSCPIFETTKSKGYTTLVQESRTVLSRCGRYGV